MVEPPGVAPDDAVLIVTLRADNRVEIWQREGRTTAELADILQWMADGFADGDAKRIG